MSTQLPLLSMLTCPRCKATAILPIPREWQQRWWKCPACRETTSVATDECCAFCVHGDLPCALGGRNDSVARDQLLRLPSPWALEPGVVRIRRANNDVSAEELCDRLYRNQMTQPYIVETPYERRLHFTRDATQSVMRLDAPDALTTAYTRKMMSFLLFNPKPKHIVMIGLGGGSLPKFCYRQLPDTQITVVEIDAEVIALREEFCVPKDDARFRIVHDDGARYIEKLDAKVDVILVDAFDGNGIAPSLASSEFHSHAACSLAPEGLMVMNLWGPPERYVANLRAARAAFGKRLVLVPVTIGENVLLFAFKRQVPRSITKELDSLAQQLQSRLQLDFPLYLQRLVDGHCLSRH